MTAPAPPLRPLESTEDHRETVRRRAAPVAFSAAVISLFLIVVGVSTDPVLVAVALFSLGVGLVLGRRL